MEKVSATPRLEFVRAQLFYKVLLNTSKTVKNPKLKGIKINSDTSSLPRTLDLFSDDNFIFYTLSNNTSGLVRFNIN